ncbi:MAG TPA: FHA domain-containing protein [Gemmataceae bacterium]|nr:FHA domain-containing protein [Gemmataceae bacterium]
MICPTCGAVNEDGVLFCEKCKADLEMPAAGSPPQAPSPMNDPLVPRPDNAPAEEPIPLEPVSDRTPPVSIEPPANADEPPIELEPVDSGAVAETAAGDTAMPAAAEPAAAAALVNPRLEVLRGQRMDAKYPIYPGKNYIGRTDDKPVDIDLDDQEAPDRIWCSRQHAVITFENGALTIEDLNSLNGTFVNRARVHPGQVRELRADDVIQIGTVHMKVVTG